jgi:catechol 2,3-dioxygenase-like lactoylglutathione lyase family enzyme
MKIKLTSVYVVDQEKALRFYTEVLGFVKKADFSQAPFRWLTTAGTGIRRSCGFSITSKRTYRAVSTSTW